MDKLKVGVIGTGHLGKLHTKMFAEIENCELVGIYDSNSDQAKKVSEEFKVQAANSIDELLGKVDAVSIAAITSAHYEIAKKCFEKGNTRFR